MNELAAYTEVLRRYLAGEGEAALLEAYDLGKALQLRQVSPDHVVSMHMEAVAALPPLSTEDGANALAVLLETMMSYGVAFAEAQDALRRSTAVAEASARELDAANRLLKEHDRLKSQFFATMNHELRTPLHAIIGFAEDALEGLGGPLSPLLRRFFTNILGAGRHLLSVISEILDLAKLQAGRTEVDTAPVAVADVFHELDETLRPMFERKGQRLAVTCPPALAPVLADRAKLYQVLLNLVSNAHKFTPEGGRVDVTAAPAGPDAVTIAVRDSGIGIATEHLAAIFEEFRQVRPVDPLISPGTGLGLAITERLVVLQGGSIAVTSELGRGTTFTVTLKAAGRASLAEQAS